MVWQNDEVEHITSDCTLSDYEILRIGNPGWDEHENQEQVKKTAYDFECFFVVNTDL